MKRFTLLLLLSLTLLAACGRHTAPSGPATTNDPVVTITSADTSTNATYTLTGSATGEGIVSLSYTVDDGTSQEIAVANPFSATVTLEPGANAIVVTAQDEDDGNGSDSITVTYDAPPSGLTASRAQAMPGDSLVLSGAEFGTAPSVTVGGVNATVTSSTADSVEIVVPDGVWGYPVITLTTGHGETALERAVFVGAEFGGDVDDDSDIDGDDLQVALDALPEAGALRLGAGTVAAGSATLVIDNRSLYGAGAKAGDASDSVIEGPVDLYVRGDNTVTLENLRLRGDSFTFRSGRVNSGGLGLQATGLAGRFVARGAVFEEVTTGAGTFSNDAYMAGLSLLDTRITVDDVYGDWTAGMTVETSEITARSIELGVDYNGDLTIENSTLTATDSIYLEVYEAGDGLIANSTLEAENFVEIYEDYSGIFTVTDSHLLAHDGYVQIYLYVGPLTITGSTIEARADADPADAGNVPDVSLSSAEAGVIVRDNPLIHADADVSIEGDGSTPSGTATVAPADVLVHGNGEIRAGQSFSIVAMGDLTLTENGMISAATGEGWIRAAGDLSASGNALSVTDGDLTVSTDATDGVASADIVFTNNVVTTTATAAYAGTTHGVEVYSSYGDLRVDSNTFDVSSSIASSAPYLTVRGTMTGAAGSCTVNANDATIAAADTSSAASATLTCDDSDVTGENTFVLTDNTVEVTGSTASSITVDLVEHNGGTATRSGNTFVTPDPSGLVINE